jgi:hypothetical protein
MAQYAGELVVLFGRNNQIIHYLRNPIHLKYWENSQIKANHF